MTRSRGYVTVAYVRNVGPARRTLLESHDYRWGRLEEAPNAALIIFPFRTARFWDTEERASIRDYDQGLKDAPSTS